MAASTAARIAQRPGVVEIDHVDARRSRRGALARRAASLMWSSAVVFLAIACAFILATLSAAIPARGFGFRGWVPMVSVLWATIGARIALRQPRNGVGWLLLLAGWLWAVTSMFEEYAAYASVHANLGLPFVDELLWFNTLTPTLVAGCSALAMLLIPDGALRSRGEIIVALVVAGLTLLVTAGYASRSTTFAEALYVLRGVIVILPVGVLVVRHRRASAVRRRQFRWIVWAAIAAAATFYLNAIVRDNQLIQLAEIGTLGAVPIAFGAAIARHHLYEIDALVSRAFVYGSATAILGTISILALAAGQRVFVAVTGERSDVAVIMALLVIAMAVTPLQAALQRLVERWQRPPVPGATGLPTFRAELESHLRLNDRARLLQQLLIECVAASEAVGGALEQDAAGGVRTVSTLGVWTGDAHIVLTIRDGRRAIRILLGPRANGAHYTRADRDRLHETADLVARVLATY